MKKTDNEAAKYKFQIDRQIGTHLTDVYSLKGTKEFVVIENVFKIVNRTNDSIYLLSFSRAGIIKKSLECSNPPKGFVIDSEDSLLLIWDKQNNLYLWRLFDEKLLSTIHVNEPFDNIKFCSNLNFIILNRWITNRNPVLIRINDHSTIKFPVPENNNHFDYSADRIDIGLDSKWIRCEFRNYDSTFIGLIDVFDVNKKVKIISILKKSYYEFEELNSYAISPDGNSFIIQTNDSTLEGFNISSTTPIKIFSYNYSSAFNVTFGKHSSLCVVTHKDSLYVIDYQKPEIILKTLCKAREIEFVDNDENIIILGDSTLNFFYVSRKYLWHPPIKSFEKQNFEVLKNNNVALISKINEDSTSIKLYSIYDFFGYLGEIIIPYSVDKITYDTSTKELITSSAGGYVRRWNFSNENQKDIPLFHGDKVNTLFRTCDSSIVTITKDSIVRQFNLYSDNWEFHIDSIKMNDKKLNEVDSFSVWLDSLVDKDSTRLREYIEKCNDSIRTDIPRSIDSLGKIIEKETFENAKNWKADNNALLIRTIKMRKILRVKSFLDNHSCLSVFKNRILTWYKNEFNLWDIRNGEMIGTPHVITNPIYCATFYGAKDIGFLLCDTTSFLKLYTFDGDSFAYKTKMNCFIPAYSIQNIENEMFAITRTDNTFLVINLSKIEILIPPLSIEDLKFYSFKKLSESLKFFIIQTKNKIFLYQLENGGKRKHEIAINLNTPVIKEAVYDSAKNSIIAVHSDNRLRIWDMRNGKIKDVSYEYLDNVKGIKLGPNKTVITLHENGSFCIWDLEDGSLISTIDMFKNCYSLDYRVEDKDLFVYTNNGFQNDEDCWKGNLQTDINVPFKQMPLFIEVVTGTKFDEYDNISVIGVEAWRKKKEKLDSIIHNK